MKRTLVIGVLAVVGCAGAAWAHDFWIEPSAFSPRVPASVSLRLRVGENFSGNPVRRNTAAISRFVSSGPQGEIDVPGLEGKDPAGFLRIDEPGSHVVGYETVGQSIELDAEPFERYLLEEGLEHAIEARRAAGLSEASGREIFYRCAKTLVRAGDAPEPSGSQDRALGLTLELVLENGSGANEPYERSVQLLFRGEPVRDALLVGLVRGQEEPVVRARTGVEGRVLLPAVSGEWLVKAVHMVPADDEPQADWKSYWASLTVEIPESQGP